MIIRRYKVTYRSMTASYDLGYVYSDNYEEALSEARRRNKDAFSEGERTLINIKEVKG